MFYMCLSYFNWIFNPNRKHPPPTLPPFPFSFTFKIHIIVVCYTNLREFTNLHVLLLISIRNFLIAKNQMQVFAFLSTMFNESISVLCFVFFFSTFS
jgi:hypothetical protein